MNRRNRNPVRHVGDEPHIGFTQVPNELCRAPIPFEARGVIVELASHTDGFSVSVSEMAQRIGCSWRSANRALNQAIASGYVARKEYRTTRGHAYYEYWVRTDRPFTADELADIRETVYLPDSPPEAEESLANTDATDSPADAAESQPDTSNGCKRGGCTNRALTGESLCITHYLEEAKTNEVPF